MTPPPLGDVWLANAVDERIYLRGNSSLGRSSDNAVVIPSERASRRHAIIHAQEGGEYWIADLGSSNGTFLNDRRVTLPTLLKPGDTIQIAHIRLTFHQLTPDASGDETGTLSQMTVVEVRTEPCWLLIADVEGFTPLSQRLPADDLAALMGRWIRTCKEHLERHGGLINKFLGDGFLAYWRANDLTNAQVTAAAKALRAAQLGSELKFRLVLHYGKVAAGGAASLNEDSLMGPEVNFAFRMEKAAAGLKADFCVSQSAHKQLGESLSLQELPGEHELKGFPAKYRFYAFKG